MVHSSSIGTGSFTELAINDAASVTNHDLNETGSSGLTDSSGPNTKPLTMNGLLNIFDAFLAKSDSDAAVAVSSKLDDQRLKTQLLQMKIDKLNQKNAESYSD